MTVMLFVQMSCVNTYAIGSNHTSVFWTAIANEALDLDKADFLADGYPVQVEGNRSTPGARPAPSSSKRKASDAWGSPSKRKRDDTDDEDSSSDDEGDDLNDEDFTPAPLETPRKSDAPGSSASSGQPPASPSTTPKSKKKKRGSVTELIKSMAASLQGLATTTTANAELNLKMHAESRKDQQDFQKFMMDQHKAADGGDPVTATATANATGCHAADIADINDGLNAGSSRRIDPPAVDSSTSAAW